MSYPTVEQIEINAENKDSFGQMQNHVCLVAQLQLAGSTSGGVKEVLDKSAKYYYGFQDIVGVIKTMYNKNPALIKNSQPLNARLNTGDSNKKLSPIIPESETKSVDDIKVKLEELFAGYKVVPTEIDPRTDFTNNAYKGLDNIFNSLLIADPGYLLGQGARVVLYAKYTKTTERKVNAYGQMLFIKKGSIESLKLNIKNSVVTLGSMVGDKKTILSLIDKLFGVTLTMAPKDEVEDGDEILRIDDDPAEEAKKAEKRTDAKNALAADKESIRVAAEEKKATEAAAAANSTFADIDGGKLSIKKRRMSFKKGGRNNSVSRKQNKKGGAKIRRSQKGGKRAR